MSSMSRRHLMFAPQPVSQPSPQPRISSLHRRPLLPQRRRRNRPVHAAAARLSHQRARAAYRRQDDGDPSRPAPRGLCHQPQQPRQDQSADRERPIEDVLGNLNAPDDDIKFGRAQQSRRPRQPHHVLADHGPDGGKPEGEVLAAIDRDLGGMEKFQNDFNAAGGRQFGSGWVFVTVGKDGKLAIETRPTRTIRSWTASARCSATTSGSTLIISTTRTAAPIISRRGGIR